MTDVDTKLLTGYRRLIHISRDLASTLDLDILLRRIIQAATEITGAETASILLYDPVAERLRFQVASNLDAPEMSGLIVPLEGSVAGWIVTNRQPVRISDVRKDERHFEGIGQAVHYQVQTLLGVPLINKDQMIGVLEVVNKQHGTFSKKDEDLMMVLAAQAAVAIENARLFQQADLISEFVHELRTPLAAISTATYLLLRPEVDKDQCRQIVNNIHEETRRLNSLAASFLDLSRLESGRVQFTFTTFAVPDVLHECWEMMRARAREEQVDLRISVPDGLPRLEADRDKLKQVLLNLLSNAIKYNRPNGSVTLTAWAEPGMLAIAVQDTGTGIPADAIPHLFEKFFRVRNTEGKADGTGLGLSICRQIVLGHNGTIQVESRPGEGSTFTVRLPLANRTPGVS